MDIMTLGIYGFLALTLMMTILWLQSLVYRDASLVDRFWGLTFVVQIFVYGFFIPEINMRFGILAVLVLIWGARLSLHIYSRNKRLGEDYRYQAMRAEHGPKKFWWYSYFSVFLLQGGLSFLIGAPLLMVAAADPVTGLTFYDYMAVAIWTIGFLFEAIGDFQLKKFKAVPSNQGKLMTTGLWSLTRHPNYFGDALLWWGYFFFALAVPGGWMSFFGPLIMTLFIVNISGVKLLEKELAKNKPGYALYMASTPAFFPDLTKLFKNAKMGT